MNEALSELVKFLQEVSPLVWQALIKQVYIEAVGYLVWGVGLAVVFFPSIKWAKAHIGREDDDVLAILALIITVTIIAPLSLLLLTSAIQHFINPEFYAIRYIINTVGGG